MSHQDGSDEGTKDPRGSKQAIWKWIDQWRWSVVVQGASIYMISLAEEEGYLGPEDFEVNLHYKEPGGGTIL